MLFYPRLCVATQQPARLVVGERVGALSLRLGLKTKWKGEEKSPGCGSARAERASRACMRELEAPPMMTGRQQPRDGGAQRRRGAGGMDTYEQLFVSRLRNVAEGGQQREQYQSGHGWSVHTAARVAAKGHNLCQLATHMVQSQSGYSSSGFIVGSSPSLRMLQPRTALAAGSAAGAAGPDAPGFAFFASPRDGATQERRAAAAKRESMPRRQAVIPKGADLTTCSAAPPGITAERCCAAAQHHRARRAFWPGRHAASGARRPRRRRI